MYTQTQIDPTVSFRNAEGLAARGMIVNLQRKSLVMEVYNPYSIVQISEILHDLTLRRGVKSAYEGRAVVTSMLNTGLTAMVSATLLDEWRELHDIATVPGLFGSEASAFVKDWSERFRIQRDYQVVVNGMRAFLSDVSRWVEQVDLSPSLPKEEGRLRNDIFFELATPLMEKTQEFLDVLETQASALVPELAAIHRSYAQAALHPLLLRAPFVFRTYTKPLGFAGDYQMVNQILDDPRQGPSTYFQIINTAFLQTPVAVAHRNRIDILVNFLTRLADSARLEGRPFRVLNIGCGPAVEIQRFLEKYPEPEWLEFELVDFSEETLSWTRTTLSSIMARTGRTVKIEYVQQSVHTLLKRQIDLSNIAGRTFDAAYCAGLFDYLSDKVCMKLITYFVSRIRRPGKLLVTNVHSNNPGRYGMEHLLEWYLIYRDEKRMDALLPDLAIERQAFVDPTGVNIFSESVIK